MTDVFREAIASFVTPEVEGYEIVRLLGQGGEARVYLARDARGREVAIKRWLDPALTAADRERLRREVAALERVEHENLVKLIELTRDDRGAPCLVLELVEGTPLAELIRQAGRLDPGRAADIGVALARAVGSLHAHGVIHRDVKASNVIVRQRDRQPVLIDLGIALVKRSENATAVVDEAPRPVEATPGLGTFPYMAPEQLGAEVPGAPSPPVDERADIYALGALLFEAVTGRPPWTNQGSWVRRNRSPLDDPVFPEVRARVREVPPELRRIIDRCLRGEPSERYASAGELEKDLRAFAAGGGGEGAAGPGQGDGRERQRVLTLAFVRLAELGDAATHRDDVRRLITQCDGHELWAEADAVCASFEAPSVAVAFGLRLLWARRQRRELPRVRGGIHCGEVTERPRAPASRERVRGPALDLSEELSSIATPDQVLISETVFDEARQYVRLGPGLPEVAWQAYGTYRFRHAEQERERELGVCEAGLPGVSPLVAPAESALVARRDAPDEILGWRPAPGLQVPRRPNWLLARKLGEGGFGEVWLATHATTHDGRAFKFCFRADRLRQLKREVILFTVLRDTLDKRWDIAQILDWQFEEAPYFIESEYSRNGSFLDWAEAQGGLARVPLELRLELVAQVADALGAAHGVGVLHKDVKPQNVLIQSFGAAYTAQLADFGVGIAARGDPQDRIGKVTAQITAASPTEVWAGASESFSRLYMAPELLEGGPAGKQSDIYSLGVMLYQVVRGDFTRAMGAGWERTIDDPLLREDVGASVDIDTARRLSSAEELAARLRDLDGRRARREAEEQAHSHEELVQSHQHLVQQRQRWMALVLVFAVLAAWALWSRRHQAAEAERWRIEAETLRERLGR